MELYGIANSLERYTCGKTKEAWVYRAGDIWNCEGSITFKGYKDKQLLIKQLKSHGYKKHNAE